MTTHEYLQKLGIQPKSCINLAFMIGEVIGDTIGSKRFVYHNTPCRCIWDWYNLDRTDGATRSKILDWPILNNEVYDIAWLSGGDWTPSIRNHRMMMILVASEEDLYKYYTEKYAKQTIEYIGKKIQAEIDAGKNPWIGRK